jgi:hypothetical protein
MDVTDSKEGATACAGGMGNLRRRERDFLVDVAPYKPTETGYQQQQYPNARPAQPLVGAVSRLADSPRALLAFSAKRIQPSSSCDSPGRPVRGEVASDPLLLIEAYDPGILPHHALVENPARENVEVLLFEGYQVTVADLRNPGNGVQRDPAELPLLP